MLPFILGIVSGAYIAQNYRIPNITIEIKKIIKNLKEYENNNNNNNNK